MSDTERRELPGSAADAERDYEPPTLEELGTIKELTLGFFIAGTPDDSTFFGTV